MLIRSPAINGNATLPALQGNPAHLSPDDVYAAVSFQRLRLRRDQQVPEWDG